MLRAVGYGWQGLAYLPKEARVRLRFEGWGYILTIEPHQTHEDAPQGAGIGSSIPYSKLRSNPDIPASKGMPSVVSDEVECYVECSVCHTRSPHLDSAGHRCQRVLTDFVNSTGMHAQQCGGVMVQRPVDPVHGTGWPSEGEMAFGKAGRVD